MKSLRLFCQLIIFPFLSPLTYSRRTLVRLRRVIDDFCGGSVRLSTRAPRAARRYIGLRKAFGTSRNRNCARQGAPEQADERVLSYVEVACEEQRSIGQFMPARHNRKGKRDIVVTHSIPFLHLRNLICFKDRAPSRRPPPPLSFSRRGACAGASTSVSEPTCTGTSTRPGAKE